MKEKKSSVVYDKSNERCANKSIARILEREREEGAMPAFIVQI